ncbi:hypothetical protein AAG906_038688 [Vitis piasezkii]
MASRRYQAEEIDQFSRLLVHEYMSNVSSLTFGVVIRLMHFQKECSTQIIHCDIKPRNILLDRHFTPRISDFEQAKLKGTITAKVDVYNFGGMSLEILGCKGRRRGRQAGGNLIMNDIKRLERLVMVAIWCIQEDPALSAHQSGRQFHTHECVSILCLTKFKTLSNNSVLK